MARRLREIFPQGHYARRSPRYLRERACSVAFLRVSWAEELPQQFWQCASRSYRGMAQHFLPTTASSGKSKVPRKARISGPQSRYLKDEAGWLMGDQVRSTATHVH
jgi:hypothetical protein